MSSTPVLTDSELKTPRSRVIDMKLEVVVIPVADIERAKRFYGALGWRLDADVVRGAFRLVQFTPPRSSCSIQFGTGVTASAAGCTQSVYLVVPDIEAARAELIARGVDASEVFHRGGPKGRLSGPDPGRASYASFVSFRRQQLVGARSDRAIARARQHGRHNLQLADRADGRTPTCGSGTWRARGAHRRARCELGGLVREVYCSGAGWQRAPDLMASHTAASKYRTIGN
jgi:catechol 2,3-dioxygenase-like lactoylglutathione lyase family enzyme